MTGIGETVLEVRNLRTHLAKRGRAIFPVDGVSFSVRRGETLGIVGESGSGKTMTALSVLRLLPASVQAVEGEVLLEGQDLLKLDSKAMRQIHGRKISMIPQDPHSSLDPVFTIGNQVLEALRQRVDPKRGNLRRGLVESLRSVRISEPERRLQSYPHQLSGGMKQRVVGAIAMACNPSVIIADEPTTALDVTIQAQYLQLLRELQQKTGVALVFITHDLGVVARMCNQVAVMYAGRIVEQGPVREIFARPAHPYTAALLASVPRLTDKPTRLASIDGQPPDLHALPPGCRFEPRCTFATERCRAGIPPLLAAAPEHSAACIRLGR